MNKIIRSLFLAISILSISTFAHASVFDFKAQAEAGGLHGESAWTTLTEIGTGFTLSINGIKSSTSAYAYLDSGNAGLGVCGAVLSGSPVNADTHSSANLCNPSDDDNITTAESLTLVFSADVTINKIWFNNNHDGDTSLLNNRINIGGTPYLFTNGGASVDSFTSTSFLVNANTPFYISFNDEEFYLSKMDVTKRDVPEPTSLILMGIGLAGLALARRNSKDR